LAHISPRDIARHACPDLCVQLHVCAQISVPVDIPTAYPVDARIITAAQVLIHTPREKIFIGILYIFQ
jgi:hypothetical protein